MRVTELILKSRALKLRVQKEVATPNRPEPLNKTAGTSLAGALGGEALRRELNIVYMSFLLFMKQISGV